MVRSLYSGVAGLTVHQTRMDVIGNNIANVNTHGFKASSVTFRDIYYQAAKSPTGGTAYDYAGNNPSTVGYGVQLGSIDKDMATANTQSTSRDLDLAIDGDGFFIVGSLSKLRNPATEDPGAGGGGAGAPADPGFTDQMSLSYTRMGRFGFDNDGNLVAGGNAFILGSSNSVPNDDGGTGGGGGGTGTEELNRDYNNLLAVGTDSSALMVAVEPPTKEELTNPTTCKDYIININDLARRAFVNEILGKEPGTITDVNWALPLDRATPPTGVTADEVDKLLNFTYKDLEGFDIGATGIMSVTYGGNLKYVARVELAVFDNPEGLQEAGMTTFLETPASGEAGIRCPGDSGAGAVSSNKLEMSNVNLAAEFSDMIVTQRGFQANARIITVSDSMIEELVNLKR